MYEEKYELSWAKIFDALMRFKRIGILLGIVVMALLVFGNKAIFPDQYEATALVRVKPNAASAVQNTDRREMIRVVQEELLSRTVLENVAKQLGMDQPSSTDKTGFQNILETVTGRQTTIRPYSMDNIVRDLRSAVAILETVGTQGGTNLFMVSMRSKDPDEVSLTVNAIVETYIKQKTTYKESDSQQAVEFLTQQLDEKGNALTVLTKKLEGFKRVNTRYITTEGSISAALSEAKLRLIEAQGHSQQAKALISDTEDILHSVPRSILTGSTGASSTVEIAPSDPHERLIYMRQRLINLRATMTEMHPEIIRVRREITSLEDSGIKAGTSRVRGSTTNPDYIRIRNDLAIAKSTERAALSEIDSINTEIATLKETATRFPVIQQTLLQLNSARESAERDYRSIEGRLTDARISLQASQTDIGNNFAIVDRAVTPTTPLVRSRLVLHVFGIVLGIVICFSVAIFLGLLLPNTNANIPSSTTGRLLFYSTANIAFFMIVLFTVVDFMKQTVVFV